MESGVVTPLLSTPTGLPAAQRSRDTPERIRDAAQQFEALLIAQILHSAREKDSGWLSLGGSGASGDSATDFAEQQLADTLARHGGLGLATIIAAGLKHESDKEKPGAGPP